MGVVESTIIEIKPTERNEVDALPVKYNITDAAINQLRLQYAGLEIIDKLSYKAVVTAIADVRGRRTSVEKRRKELKAEVLDYGRRVDGEAKRITELLEAIEEPLKSKRQTEDSKEVIRIAAIQAKIDTIKTMVPTVPTSSDALSEILFNLDTMEIGVDFEEFREQAESVRAEASAKINQMISDRLKWEAEEKSRQEELSMLEAIKTENFRIEAERKAREEADEKIRRAEREAIEEEKRFLLVEREKIEAAKLIEQERKEREVWEQQDKEMRTRIQFQEKKYRDRFDLMKGPIKFNTSRGFDQELHGIGFVDRETGEEIISHDDVLGLSDDDFSAVADGYNLRVIARKKGAEAKAAKERVEFERIAIEKAEQKAKEKQEREEAERKSKAEAEAGELARQEALKPDKKKLLDFSYRLESLNISKTTSQGAKIIAFEIMDRVDKLINFIRIEVEKL